MIDLRGSRFTDIMPENLASQVETRAYACAVGRQIEKLCIYADGIRIYAAIDSMPEKILDVLAVELRTPVYSQKFSIEIKRALVKGTFSFYARMGTPTACNKIIETIFGSGRIEEWFDYEGEPHHFRAYAGDGKVDAKDLAEFRQVLGHVKRLSSWLDEIIITLPVTRGEVSIKTIPGPRLSRATLPRHRHKPPTGQFCVTPFLGVRRSTITLPWAAEGGRTGRWAQPNDGPIAAHEGG